MQAGASEEASLVERAQGGDVAAFETLYRGHIDRVYGLCLRMTANRAEAEDCAQEAFIQAWLKLSLFRYDAGFGTWLHRIAVNAVLGRIRKAKREKERLALVADATIVTEAVADNGNIDDLARIIDELPEGARHAFVLHAVYGYSHRETSEMLGIAEGTSKAQVHRARNLLTQQLNEAQRT